MLKTTFAVAVLIASSIVVTTPAKAACHHAPIPWRFGQFITSEWITDDKSVCTSTSNHPETIGKIEIESKPEHGIAGKNGPYAVAYKPKPGFHGSDSFTYVVISNSFYRRGPGVAARIAVSVTVK